MNIAFIPARCGSKSIPYKNIKNFYGRPLIYWTLLASQKSKNINEVFVATDCEEIKAVVNSFKLSKVKIYYREPRNAIDTSTTESAMLEFIENNNFEDKDLFFLIQATSPLTQYYHLDAALKQLKNENSDSLLTCVRTKRFYWNDNSIPLNYNFNNRPRRQDFKGTLMENGAFYINTIGNIKKYKNRLSGKISIYEMEEFTSIEIDEEDDWAKNEELMKRFSAKGKKRKKIKLFLSDVDGTLTDAGMYYGENGEELKKFNTHDGKGFELLRQKGIKTGLITSESTNIVKNRSKKLQIDYLFQDVSNHDKLEAVLSICKTEKISLDEVAYVGDDLNCKNLLMKVKYAACPSNSVKEIMDIPNIIKLEKSGGDGAVREFIDFILNS